MKKTFKIPVNGYITVKMDDDGDDYSDDDRQANAEYDAQDLLDTLVLGNTIANFVRADLNVVHTREIIVHS